MSELKVEDKVGESQSRLDSEYYRIKVRINRMKLHFFVIYCPLLPPFQRASRRPDELTLRRETARMKSSSSPHTVTDFLARVMAV